MMAATFCGVSRDQEWICSEVVVEDAKPNPARDMSHTAKDNLLLRGRIFHQGKVPEATAAVCAWCLVDQLVNLHAKVAHHQPHQTPLAVFLLTSRRAMQSSQLQPGFAR
jgi:hypothetical protein